MTKYFRYFIVGLAFALAFAPWASAQPRHSDDLGGKLNAQPPTPYTPEKAAEYLNTFRHVWFGSDVAIHFTLVHRPRRGEDVTFQGTAWSTWLGSGPATRIQVVKPSATKSVKPEIWEWVLLSGPTPHVWVLAPGATAATEVPPAKWREPLLPGMLYTPFDLMAPFLYWADFKYNATDRILGRGVDVYTMNPPAVEKAAGLLPVKVYIDRELDALVRTQELDAKGQITLQFDLDKVAKVQDKWMLKSCNLIDVAKNDYDVFTVESAAVPTDKTPFKLDPAIFTPAGLNQPVAPLPLSAWVGL